MTGSNRHQQGDTTSTRTGVSRRRTLTGAALVIGSGLGLAGCLGSEEERTDPPARPIDLTEGQTCAVCGMTIADHFGPAGQLF